MIGKIIEKYKVKKLKDSDSIKRLKKVIAVSGETRLSILHRKLEIRINVLCELMNQLAREGFLEKQERKFIITASQEELNKWRDN